MNLGKNIYDAFSVVAQSHENAKKLMDYCKVTAEEEGKYELVTPHFLRYKSDVDHNGWNLKSFILLFQSIDKKKMKNNWRNAPIYALEINFYDEAYEEPMLTVAKFTYENMKEWTPKVSPASHYIFYDPLYYYDYETDSKDKDLYMLDFPSEVSDNYWGLEKVECKVFPLINVTRENAYEKVFETFDYLKGLPEE